MVSLFTPGGPLQQLSNLWFLMAALVSDVLLIRLFLCLAYIFLIAASASGLPNWPSVSATGWLALDIMLWSTASLVFHGFSLLRLLWDEHSVSFAGPDEEQLWRFFHRRGGMGRLEMRELLKRGGWRRVPAGEPVLRRGEGRLLFCVLVEGRVCFQALHNGEAAGPATLMHSGSCFDMALLNVFGVFVGLEKDETRSVFAKAVDDCLLYCWRLEELNEMASDLAPAVAAFWRNFTMCQLGLKVTWMKRPDEERLCATGQLESPVVHKGGRSRDFTDPLREYEQHSWSVAGVARWLLQSFSPFPPRGLRHTALPTTGILARNRLIALKTAQARALIERDSFASGSSEAETANLSERGGTAAYEILVGLPTLAHIRAVRTEELVLQVCPHHGPGCPAAGAEHLQLARRTPYDRSLSVPASPVTKGIEDVA